MFEDGNAVLPVTVRYAHADKRVEEPQVIHGLFLQAVYRWPAQSFRHARATSSGRP